MLGQTYTLLNFVILLYQKQNSLCFIIMYIFALSTWSSLVAQLVKNLPVVQEVPVQFLAWEDPLEKGTAIHSRILAWRILWTV